MNAQFYTGTHNPPGNDNVLDTFSAQALAATSGKRRLLRLAALPVCLFFATIPDEGVVAATLKVCAPNELTAAIAKAEPGDTIEMCNGTWADTTIHFDVAGTRNKPIRLVAETSGEVVLKGSSRITLAGRYAVIDGLAFRGRYTGSANTIIEFRGRSGNCHDCRLTNVSMMEYNPKSQSEHTRWVVLHGKRNRVDHSHFKGKTNLGAMVQVHRNSDQTPNYHLIDHNLFEDRPEIKGEGNVNGDTLEIGSMGKYSSGESATTVELNYFRNIDSDYEAVTVKSSGNILQYNVLDSSRGVFSLRSGSGNVVHGNFILGRGKPRTGGITVRGRDHIVSSNYISGVNSTGIQAYAALSLNGGTDEIVDKGGDTTPYYKFPRAENVKVLHNTIVDSGASVSFGNGGDLPPRNVELSNNIVLRGKGPAIVDSGMGSKISFHGNIYFDCDIGLRVTGIELLDPKLEPDAVGIERPTSMSPVLGAVLELALAAAPDSGKAVLLDMDGQERTAPSDIGADEVIPERVARGPVSVCGVGPETYRLDAAATCDESLADTAAPRPPQSLSVE